MCVCSVHHGCLLHRRIFNTLEDVQYTVEISQLNWEDILSTSGCCSVHRRDTKVHLGKHASNFGDVQKIGGLS